MFALFVYLFIFACVFIFKFWEIQENQKHSLVKIWSEYRELIKNRKTEEQIVVNLFICFVFFVKQISSILDANFGSRPAEIHSQKAYSSSGSVILPGHSSTSARICRLNIMWVFVNRRSLFFSYLRRSLSSCTIGLYQDPSASKKLPQI